MSVRKIGRKARALAGAKPNQRFIDEEWQRRRDMETAPRKRELRRQMVSEFVEQFPSVSTRVVERRFGMHRNTITNVREEIGFVVPKKDYRCHKVQYDNAWPKQPGERPGICACGCGGQTTRSKNGSSKTGMKPGDYFRFIHGHQWLLRRRLCKPKGWRSSHEIMQERERLRATLVETAAKLPRYTSQKVATFEDLRNRLKKIELNGHNVVDQQIARMVNIGRRCFTIGLQVPTIIHANTATRVEWRERLITVSASLGKPEVLINELRARLGPNFGLSNVAISRFINQQRETQNERLPVIIFPQRRPEREKPVEPITEHYPYATAAEDDLINRVYKMLPERYGNTRADMCQDIILALLQGECELNNVPALLSKFRARFLKRFGYMGHNIISLDAPLSEDGGTLHDILSIGESITEFRGGMNYETRGTYFERREQWDGEICAHY